MHTCTAQSFIHIAVCVNLAKTQAEFKLSACVQAVHCFANEQIQPTEFGVYE